MKILPYWRWYMKITTLLYALVALAMPALKAAPVHAQALEKRVTATYTRTNLHQVILDLKAKTNIDFGFTQELGIEKITIEHKNFENETLAQVLQSLLAPTKIAYTEKAGAIILSRVQQAGRIRGKVSDDKGAPLAGASVKVVEAARSTSTDKDGNFDIAVPPGIYTVEANFISYTPDRKSEIRVDEGQAITLNFTMKEAFGDLEEVIVVGYGTQKKENITGSVSTLKGEKITAAPATNPSDGIAGRIPGLVALTPSGEPGSSSNITIRGANTLGNNAPLVVVDGIPNREWERLNPQDIESITVLKDASAAIYGARAANGVIMVTTKKGSAGHTQIQFSYNEAKSAPTVIPRAADAATYAQLLNEILAYEGAAPIYSNEDIQKYQDGSDPLRFPNTNWYDVTLKDWASQRNADLNISGGQENLRYYISAGTRFQDAIYNNSATSYKQHNIRLNLDGDLSKYVKYGVNVAAREVYRDYPTESSSTIWDRLRASKPNMPAFWPHGEAADNGDSGNPVVITTNQTGYDRNKTTVLETRATIDVQVPWVQGLSISGNAALDKSTQNDKLWKTPWYLYAWDRTSLLEDGSPVLSRVQRGYSNAELTQEIEESRLVTLNALAKYDFSLANHHKFNFMAGVERMDGNLMAFNAFRKNYVSTAIDQLFAGGDIDKNNGGSASTEARLNYFGRANYNFKDRYLLEFVWRYDGSYIFPKESRFGFFPGVSGGWRVSEEPFWKPLLPYINDFKLRGSWGKTGNDRIDPYQFLSSYAYATGAADIYVFNESEVSKILYEARIANPGVTWEVANQTNLGLDLHLFNSKFVLSAEYFYNLRTDILWERNASVPGSTGLTLPDENIGEVINKGAEFQVGYNGGSGDFKYTLSANVSLNKNKIRFWDETPGVPSYQQSTGRPMNTGLYYNAIGIFRDEAALENYPHWAGARPGDIIFEDVNGDNEINALDRIRIDKTSLPTHIGGFNADLSWKGLYASLFFQWALGAVRNDYYEMQGQIGNYLARNAAGRWTPENPDAEKPRTWNRYNEYWRSNSNTYWLQKTDYLRLKSVQLGYNLPSSICSKISAKAVQVYLSGLNLLTFTGVEDFDPESTAATSYPANKVYNLGVSVTF
ncbi:TonB-dependent receptor [Olivibacter sp. XZL3]|uniref:SusC/RagA family TonB-linked outer membrane protein n=1 Tax=Olivibacter sp. XZL3 TaxID=1735116 RepID=UPI001F0D7D05|nr:TonB-dependent receptor [Olivibacter sp. XZL3]